MPSIEDILAPLDKTKPIYVAEKRPSVFKTKLDEEKWYAKIMERCTYGDKNEYGLFIPPSLVFFSQFGTVVDRISGGNEELIIRDVDYALNILLYDAMQRNKFIGIIKSRNVGFSVQGGGNFPLWFATVFPGCTINMTSADQSRITNLYRKALLPSWQGMPDAIRPDQVTQKNSDGEVGLMLRVNTIENNKRMSRDTSILCKATAYSEKAASAFSGGGAKYSYVDELYLNPRAEKIVETLIEVSTRKQTGKLEGIGLFGGTAENSISPEQLQKYKKFWLSMDEQNPDSIWIQCFLPFYLGSFMENGHSNVEKATIDWEKKQEAWLKAGNTESATAHRKNQPRSINDIFEFAASSKWEKDVSDSIKVQYDRALQEKQKGENIWTPSIITKINDKLDCVPTNKSPITVFEHPKPNVKYWTLVDGTSTGTESGNTDGSAFSSIVVKGYDPNGISWAVTALYTERPKTVEAAYIQTLYLSEYYNIYNGLVCIAPESNNLADYYSTWMAKQNKLHMVMKRKDLSGNGNLKDGKYGQPRTKETIDYQYRWANTFLRKYISSIKCIPLLEDMLREFSENTDVLDSWLMMAVALPPDWDQQVTKKKSVRKMIWYNENGKTGFKVVTEGEHGTSYVRPRENPHLFNATPK